MANQSEPEPCRAIVLAAQAPKLPRTPLGKRLWWLRLSLGAIGRCDLNWDDIEERIGRASPRN